MSEDYQYDSDGNRIVKRVTKINVNVDEDKIADKVADKIADSLTQKKALEAFNREKRVYAIKYNDKDFLDCNSPKELDDLAQQIEAESNKPTHKYPTGKNVNEYSDGETFDSPEALMDSLYERGYNRGIKVKTEDGIKAREQIDQLFRDMITGKGWKQLKSGEERFPRESMELMYCPKCRSTINAKIFPPCPICGYDPIKEDI